MKNKNFKLKNNQYENNSEIDINRINRVDTQIIPNL